MPPSASRLPCHAFVLTAGLGTRFRPLSLERAKAAAPVAGVPLIHRILRWLSASGVTHAMLNLHHRPESIASLVGDGSDLGILVRYSWEPTVLGSAGGPRLALDLIGSDPFLLVNGDTLTDVDLGTLLAAHESSGALVTMAVIPNPEPKWYGGVQIDDRHVVTGFPRAGRSAGSNYHFIGVQVARRDAFEGVAHGAYAESVGQIYPRLMTWRPGSVRAFVCDATFRDVGTPADYLSTCLAIADAEHARGSLLSGARIDPTAHVAETVLWNDVEVETGANLVRCVVGAGVTISKGAAFAESVIVRAGHGRPAKGERVERDLLIAPLTVRSPEAN